MSVSYTYNAQGEVIGMKDQAGTTHEYVLDTGGRRTDDKAMAFGSGIDQTVKRISTVYDDLNLTDDDQACENVWDAWNRLVTVKNQSHTTVAEYTYYPGPMMATAHWDLTNSGGGGPDGSVNSSDPYYCSLYDRSTRLLAEFRWISGDNTDQAKYIYLPDNAGLGGFGGSSYINDVILTDRDDTTGEKSASDGGYDARYEPLPNWRHDVVAFASSAGRVKEWVKYSAYGVPYGEPLFEVDGDGTVGISDAGTIGGWIGLGSYDVRADSDMDSDLDATDNSAITANTLGNGVLSKLGNRGGIGGYRLRPELAGTKYHARHRFLDSATGRWLSRDPAGYVNGVNMMLYVAGSPLYYTDALGLAYDACAEGVNDLKWEPRLLPTSSTGGEFFEQVGSFAGNGTGIGDPRVLELNTWVTATDSYLRVITDAIAWERLVYVYLEWYRTSIVTTAEIYCDAAHNPDATNTGVFKKKNGAIEAVNSLEKSHYPLPGTSHTILKIDVRTAAAYKQDGGVKITYDPIELSWEGSGLEVQQGCGAYEWQCVCCKWRDLMTGVIHDGCRSGARPR